jgi:hypothetical protein
VAQNKFIPQLQGRDWAAVGGLKQMSPSLASGKGLRTKWWYHLYVVKIRGGQGTYNNITYLAYLQHHQQQHCCT